jgi:hypothetical protein
MRKLHKSLKLKVGDISYDEGKRKDIQIMIDNIEILLPRLENIYDNFFIAKSQELQELQELPLFGGKVKRINKRNKKESKKNLKKDLNI